MNNVLSDIFEETMRRERHTATTFTTGEEFECFFRRSNDNLNKHDTMVMYYRVNAPIRVGTLIKFRGYTYIALNRETVENSVYYKSVIIRTNGTVNTHSLSVVNLPFYSDGINNNNATNSTHLSIIDGDAELLTEDNSLSRKLKINDLLNVWKRTLKITNLFFIDNICHIIVKINSDITPNVGYKAVLSALSSLHVKPGDTDKITSIMYINDAKVEDATIFYESSNEQVATIDKNGNIEYLTDGMVFFIATWTEQGISAKTDTVTVTSEQTDDNVTIYMDSISEIYNGLKSDFSCYAVKNGLRDDNIAVSIRVENLSGSINQEAYIKLIKISKLSNGKYQIFVDNSNMVYRTFDLVATTEGHDHDAETRQTIKVKSFL